MADLHVHRDRLEIHLSRAEKVLSLRKSDLIIPRASIRSVAITEDPWIWIRGVRSPGASIPLTLAVGEWKFHGGRDFLLLKGKQRSAVVLDLDPNDSDVLDESVRFSRVIVSTQHAANLIEALRVEPTGDEADAAAAASE